MDPGIYTLILRLDGDVEITVGALGPIHFRRGCYAYTGSARGPGGLKRVTRHIDVLEGRNPARRWHIDHLLPHTRLVEVAATRTGEDLECLIASKVGSGLSVVRGFGSTDCGCAGHLHYSEDCDGVVRAVRRAHASFNVTDHPACPSDPSGGSLQAGSSRENPGVDDSRRKGDEPHDG